MSFILDNEAPNLDMCPLNQTLDTQAGQSTAIAVWEHPSASDNSGDKPNITCDSFSRSEFIIGQTLVTCEAIDSSGNLNSCSFQINVKGTLSWRVFLVKTVYFR